MDFVIYFALNKCSGVIGAILSRAGMAAFGLDFTWELERARAPHGIDESNAYRCSVLCSQELLLDEVLCLTKVYMCLIVCLWPTRRDEPLK